MVLVNEMLFFYYLESIWNLNVKKNMQTIASSSKYVTRQIAQRCQPL